MKLRVILPVYTHDQPDDPEVLEQLHLPHLTSVEVRAVLGGLILTGPKDDIAEVLFFYHDRDLETAAHEMLYTAEVIG